MANPDCTLNMQSSGSVELEHGGACAFCPCLHDKYQPQQPQPSLTPLPSNRLSFVVVKIVVVVIVIFLNRNLTNILGFEIVLGLLLFFLVLQLES